MTFKKESRAYPLPKLLPSFLLQCRPETSLMLQNISMISSLTSASAESCQSKPSSSSSEARLLCLLATHVDVLCIDCLPICSSDWNDEWPYLLSLIDSPIHLRVMLLAPANILSYHWVTLLIFLAHKHPELQVSQAWHRWHFNASLNAVQVSCIFTDCFDTQFALHSGLCVALNQEGSPVGIRRSVFLTILANNWRWPHCLCTHSPTSNSHSSTKSCSANSLVDFSREFNREHSRLSPAAWDFKDLYSIPKLWQRG